MKSILVSIVWLLMLVDNTNAITISYSNGIPDQTKIFNMGASKKQGQAIRLSKAKLHVLKGKNIDAVEICIGSRNTEGKVVHAFISTSLTDTPIVESDISISKAFVKNKWILDKPYTITGDEEELYIGYLAESQSANSKLLVADGNYDIKGCNFAFQGDKWVDTYGTNRGSAYISINVGDVPDYADVILGKNNFDRYYKVGGNYDFSVNIVNAGTTTVNSFDAIISVDGKESVRHFADLSILPKGGYRFSLQDIDFKAEVEQKLHIIITNINGNDDDIDPSDNEAYASIFFYPENMERSVLVEEFTGQECSGCPGGHVTIGKAITQCGQSIDDNVVEVSHHAGYYTDIFTMAEDNDFRFFYPDPTHTYAPAVMANRLVDNATAIVAPLIDTSNYGSIVQLISNAAETHPYASLNLETSLDSSKRELKVKFQIKPHVKLPRNSVFNVFLVQDSIRAYQNNGGEHYCHNNVFRGTLTGESFGLPVGSLAPGEIFTWDKTMVIPEKIHSSFYTEDMLQEVTDDKGNKSQMYVYFSPASSVTLKMDVDQTNIDAVFGNMALVAYLAEYDKTDCKHNTVYNSVEVKLGDSHKQSAFDGTASIGNVERKEILNVYVNNGGIHVDGRYDKMYVYDIAGFQMNAMSPLPKGIYVARIVSNGRQVTKKIFIK